MASDLGGGGWRRIWRGGGMASDLRGEEGWRRWIARCDGDCGWEQRPWRADRDHGGSGSDLGLRQW